MQTNRENYVVAMSVDELSDLIREQVTEVVQSYIQPPTPSLPEKMRVDDAVKFLNTIGFKTSKSNLQKLCASDKVPHYKICGKCIFTQKELTAFVENQQIRKGGI